MKTKSALDHEDRDSYTVTVKASDGNGGVDTIDVTITVTDVNEAPGFRLRDSYSHRSRKHCGEPA